MQQLSTIHHNKKSQREISGLVSPSWRLRYRAVGARLVAAANLLLVLVGLHSAPAVALEPGDLPKFENAQSWNIGSATIVDKGRTETLAAGKFTHDFILEAKATAVNPTGSLVPAGTFRLVMSAFSPASDQRGQKKGMWYVHGKWTLTDEKAAGAGHAGAQAGVISGQINAAELPFNPVTTPKAWAAKVRLPISRIVPVGQTGTMQLSRGGDGTLEMDSKYEGKLTLNLRLQSVMLNQEQGLR